MFIGEYQTQLGEKNRLAIPKKLREQLDGKVYITRGYEKCLILIDQNRWSALLQQINQNPLLETNARETKRYILGGASEIEYDSQGRFVLPDQLKKFSKINTSAIFLGVGEWIEIWNEEAWIMKLDTLSTDAALIADRLMTND